MILWCAGVYQQPPTFRSVTLQPVGVDKATIWQIKENFLSFDMMYVRSICPKRLHGKIKWRPLPFFPLVSETIWNILLFRLLECILCDGLIKFAR